MDITDQPTGKNTTGKLPQPLKAAIYCRLSEEDQNKLLPSDESESIQNQKSMLLTYAMEQGWEIYGIYSDDDYTGSDRKRPAFNRLLKDAQEKNFDIILCKTQSRFTRELELVEKYLHGLFPVWGIRFVSIVDHVDSEDKKNKKSRQINGLVNEWYLEDMSCNIKSVLTDKRKKGLHIGSSALYGYKKDPDKKGHLIIDEEAASVVKEVFTMFVQGFGKTAIARILNDRGIPNPTEYKRQHALSHRQTARKNDTLWKYSSIANMLKNEIYIGNMVQGKYGSISYKTKQNRPRPKSEWFRVEGTHEPIIEKELWNRVQELLKQRSKPFSSGKIGLFAGKVRCAGCGHMMRSTQSHGKYYLQCSSRHVSKNACTGAFLSVEELERAVIEELSRLSAEYLNTDELNRQITVHDNTKSQERELRNTILLYQKKISDYEKGLRDLYLDKTKGLISEQEYISMKTDFSNEKKDIESLLSDNGQKLKELEKHLSFHTPRTELINAYIHPEKLNRETVEMMIDVITVSSRIPGTRNVPIEIRWNF